LSLESRKMAQMSDPGAEMLDRVQALWNRYGKVALGVLGAAAVIAALGFFMLRSRQTTEAQAASKLAEANVLFWQGQYDRSLDAAKQVSKQFGSTPSGNDAHRLAGDDAFWNGLLRSQPADYKTAITEYRAYLDHVKTGVLANAARRSLAYSLESDKQYAEAAKTYDQLVGTLDRESSGEFLMASARCYQALGQKADAIQRLQRLVDEFGDTSFAAPARVRLAELKTSNS
jgi:tetratricopeptide (TPR) repeat protein